MMEIAVLGGSEFILGFQLAGITRTMEVSENPANEIKEVMKAPDVGIIVIDEKTMEKLDENTQQLIESSIKPVSVVVSTKDTNEALRRLIKKSIGVDLLGK